MPATLRSAITGFILIALGLVLGSCAYTGYGRTEVVEVYLGQSFRGSSPPLRTAFVGLYVNTFSLSDSLRFNPFLAQLDQIENSKSTTIRFKPETLIQAYAVSISDRSVFDVFRHEPSGFGGSKILKRRMTISDSLNILAHAFLQRSITERIGKSGVLGSVLPPEEALNVLFSQGRQELYSEASETIKTEGELRFEQVENLCRELQVDALLFVSVLYDTVLVTRANQYGSDVFEATSIQTDARVYRNGSVVPASVKFSHTCALDLYGLKEAGRLIDLGLRGRPLVNRSKSRL